MCRKQEKRCAKIEEKQKRILQSKKRIYPLFGKKMRIEMTKLTCLIHKKGKKSKQIGIFGTAIISYLFNRHVGSYHFSLSYHHLKEKNPPRLISLFTHIFYEEKAHIDALRPVSVHWRRTCTDTRFGRCNRCFRQSTSLWCTCLSRWRTKLHRH